MREIKFRGYQFGYGWVYGCYVNNDGVHEIHSQDGLLISTVDPNSVGQYTGLKDSKGAEVYEGDIVLIAGYGDYEVEFPFLTLYESLLENDIGEVVDCTYENPELIKEIEK